MRKSVSLLTALAIAAAMTSCRGSASDDADLSDLKKELENYSFSQHDNLTFDCVPEPITADEVYIITAKPKKWKSSDGSTKEDLKKYVDLVLGTDIDVGKMQYSFAWTDEELEAGELDSSIERFNHSAEYIGDIVGELFASSNTFSVSDFHEYNYGGDLWPKYRELHFPSALPTEAFDMFDGSKLTIEEAKSEAEGYIKHIEPLFNEGSSYRLKRALVADYPEKGVEIDLRYEHMFYGLPVCDAGFDMIRDNMQYVYSPFIEVKLLGKNYLAKLSNSHYDLIDKKEKVEKLIPLSRAEELASENLAPNITATVTEVSLEYVCVTEQQEEVHTYRPMWCFTLENYEADFPKLDLFPRRTVLVDAVTGKTYYSDGKAYQFEGD